jgi:hypothetical protein
VFGEFSAKLCERKVTESQWSWSRVWDGIAIADWRTWLELSGEGLQAIERGKFCAGNKAGERVCMRVFFFEYL